MLDIKIKKNFLQISTAAFTASLIPQIINAVLSSFTHYAPLDIGSYQLIMFITYINTLVSYAIAPVLIFAVFYFIGKKPELKLELRPILLTLLIGFLASFFVGSIIYSAMVMEMTAGYILTVMLYFTMTFFAADLFATLAGLSIGHTRQKKLTPITEQELS